MTKNNKGTTLEDLANMVAKGFESNDKRLDHVEDRMATKIDIVKIEQRLGQIEYHVDEAHDILRRFE